MCVGVVVSLQSRKVEQLDCDIILFFRVPSFDDLILFCYQVEWHGTLEHRKILIVQLES